MYMYIYYIYIWVYLYIIHVCVCVFVYAGSVPQTLRLVVNIVVKVVVKVVVVKLVTQRCEFGAQDGPFCGAASIRRHTSAFVRIRQHAVAPLAKLPERPDMSLNRH
jgi:hypothetical protein